MKGAARENFILVAKLFFIMGKIPAHSHKSNKKTGPERHFRLPVFLKNCTGIPWLAEFISQWVTHSQGQ